MTERDLQDAVMEMAKLLGWRCVHFRPARTLHGEWRTAIEGHAGFPDLVLLRPPRLVFAELKSKKRAGELQAGDVAERPQRGAERGAVPVAAGGLGAGDGGGGAAVKDEWVDQLIVHRATIFNL